MGTFWVYFQAQESEKDYVAFRLRTSENHSLWSAHWDKGKTAERDKALQAVRDNAENDTCYEKAVKGNRFLFTLRDGTGNTLGTSRHYDTEAERDQGIESVKKEAKGAVLTQG